MHVQLRVDVYCPALLLPSCFIPIAPDPCLCTFYATLISAGKYENRKGHKFAEREKRRFISSLSFTIQNRVNKKDLKIESQLVTLGRAAVRAAAAAGGSSSRARESSG